MSIPPPAIAPGDRLDRYELLCPLAQGGMASVWIARQTGKHGFEKLVALKMILPQFASDERFQTMFLDEAHIAAGIEHPNVAQILDLGEENKILYLAMEWIDGDSLAKLQKVIQKQNQLIPPAIVCRLLAETCAGLHAAHELRGRDGELLGVVHRDVSPQNVLVSAKGIAKVIDFGIAKARDRISEDTNAGVLKGKIRYMAPEQASGRPIDRRADVWAIGAMLYHLLSNKLPFDGSNDVAALHRLMSGKPPLPLPMSVPRPLAEVVKATLLHDPEKRIATCGELQQRIESAMAESSLRASNADVAEYVRTHMADRAKARKEALEIALNAAQERARVNQVLSLKESPSSSGQYSMQVTNLAKMATDPGMGSAPGIASTPGIGSASGIGGASSTGSHVMQPISTPSEIAPRPDPKKRVMIFGGAGAVVIVIALVALLSRSKPAPVAAESPAKNVTPAAAPPASAAPKPVETVAATPEPVIASATAPSPSVTAKVTAPAVVPVTAKPAKPASSAKKTTKSSDVDDGF